MPIQPAAIFTRFRQNPFFYHLLGWSIFILYELLFVIVLKHVKGDHIFFDYVLPYSINICLFYFHARFTLAFCFTVRRKFYLLFIFLLFAELTIYMYVMNLNNFLSGYSKYNPALLNGNWIAFFTQLFRGVYFAIMSTAYWLIIRSVNYQKQIMEMERMQVITIAHKNKLEKNLVETENAYLQSQINPHLLFNTLNFIYNNVQEASQKASEAVLLLSELMNYSLREQDADGKASLEKEVAQVNNIIRINQIRFDNTLFLTVHISGDFQHARIIPLGILVFIENVFKHGDLTDINNPGNISLTFDGSVLELATGNKKKNRNSMYSHGTGLANITKRLDTAYKSAYTLNIRNEDTQYYLYLSLNLGTSHDNLLHY